MQGRDISRQIKYRKGLALLAYLAVQRERWVARQQLAELLWPDLAAAAGLTNLRQVLNNLSWVLDEPTGLGLIRSERERVGLFVGPALELDLALLETPAVLALEARLPELAAPFLDGFQLRDCEAYAHWLQGARQALAQAQRRLLRAACQAQREQGRLAAAALSARLLWEQDRLDEAAAAQLMCLLLDCGDRRGAQEVLATLDQHLVADLGRRAPAALRALLDRPAPAPAASLQGQPTVAAKTHAELRWLTLLYIGFEPVLDADDAQEEGLTLLPPLMQQAQALLGRWGGHSPAGFGTGIHACFGGRAAPEQAALRSLMAAQQLLQELGAAARLRIGICAGQALCTGGEHDFGLLGELPARAQALSAEALAGQIVLGHELREQLGPRFRFRELPPGADRRHLLLPSAAAGPAPGRWPRRLIGREPALRELRHHWQRAMQGQPQWLVLRGEAGLGKTALATLFARQLRAQGVPVLCWRCGLELQHQALAPLRQALAEFCDVRAEMGSVARQRALRQGLRTLLGDTLDEPALQASCALLDRLFQPEPGSSADLKNALFALVFELLDRWCGTQPGLLWVDDLHWSDQATRELLARYAGQFGSQRLLLLVTTRPEIVLEAAGTAPGFIDLAPLAPEDAQAMAAAQAGPERLPAPVLAEVAQASGGIPLFIECLTRSRLEGGATALLPVTELMQAELDRLGRFKPVLQAAAVIGLRFDASLLADLCSGESCDAVLRLAEAQRLIVSAGAPGRYAFRHALIHEAAYASLPALERRRLHARLLDLLKGEPALAASEVARHSEAARQWNAAMRGWQAAGREALAQEFAADALRHFEQALALALQHGSAALQRELRLELAVAALKSQGYGSSLAHGQFEQVSAQIDALAEPDAADRDARFIALSGRYMGADSQEQGLGPALALRLEALAGTPAERLMACFARGNSLFWEGRFAAALRYQQEGAALAATLDAEARQRHTGDDLGVLLLAFQCWTLWFLGRGDEARAVAEQGQALARHGGRAHALCFMLSFQAAMLWSAGAYGACAQVAEEALAQASRHGFALWQGVNGLFGLAARAQSGSLRDVTALLQAAQLMRQAYRAGSTTARWVLARALLCLGQRDETVALLRQTLDEAQAHGQHFCRADLLCLLAQALEQRGETGPAIALRQQACSLAQAQGALGLLARWDAA